MRKSLLLVASAVLLFAACRKDSSDPVTPTPVTGDGTGKFTFSMDTALFRVDTLTVSYRGRDGQVRSLSFMGQNAWTSPDLLFKTGDSLQATVQAVGELKVPTTSLSGLAGVEFTANPSTIAVPVTKSTNGGSQTLKRNTTRFLHNSSRQNRY
jgi:hypothetical protein